MIVRASQISQHFLGQRTLRRSRRAWVDAARGSGSYISNFLILSGGKHARLGHRPPRVRNRKNRRPALRRVSRASGAGDLYRHLRARSQDRQRRRNAPGRHRAGSGIEGPDRALPRRQFRIRLQLGGRRRPAQGPADAARPRLAYVRVQRGRGARVRPMVRRRRRGDDARHQSRFARARPGAKLRRIRQRPDRQRLGRSAQEARPRRTVRGQALVPRQRDGRAVAGRPQDRRRIWPPRQRSGQDAARLRSRARTDRLRLLALRHEDLSGLGAHRPRAHLRRGRSHLAAYVFRQPEQERPRISRPERQARRLYQRRRLDDRIRPNAKAQQEAGNDLVRRVERLVSLERAGPRDPGRRQGLAARAAAARGHLQFRGRAPGRPASSTPSSAARTW